MFKTGSTVSITVQKDGREIVYEGLVLERAGILNPDIVVLKLDNGYNVGIDTKTIISHKVLAEPKPATQKKSHITPNTNLPKVAFLSFGGTISSRIDYKTGGVVADYDATDFYAMCPELQYIAQIEAVSVAKIMSEDMTPTHWEQMAKAIAPYLADDAYAGVVVTQGTDTLHYATSAMSFALAHTPKPIIFTASQRSIDRGSSDAFENIIAAVIAAAHFDGAVVATCMHESSNDGACTLIRGTKVRKMHTSRRDSFRPINAKPLARVRIPTAVELADEESFNPQSCITQVSAHYPKRSRPTNSDSTASSAKFGTVGLVNVYPGMQPNQLEVFKDASYGGLVIGATALGHIPEQLLDIVFAIATEKPVCIASQTIYGRVHPYVYSRLREQSMVGNLLFLDDMLCETAYAKLSYAVGTFSKNNQPKISADTYQKIVSYMKQNIAGEFNGELSETEYLN